MQTPTRTIETPIGKHKVEIREWITTRKRQYINEPMYASVEAKPQVVGGQMKDINIGKFDINRFMVESETREIECFVVSVDGETELELDGKKVPAFEFVLDGMHEKDGEFIREEINKAAKKNETPST